MFESCYANLPPEILINIFQNLEFYDLQAVKLCCKHWYAVTMLPEFDSHGVIKITSGTLNANHPAAEILLHKRIRTLYLKGVSFTEADELFKHIGESLNALTLKLVPIDIALHLTMKYFPNLRYLKVSHIKLASLVDNLCILDKLYLGNITQINELVLTANDPKVNTFILNSISETSLLKVFTIEFGYINQPDVLNFLEKYSHSLMELNLRYFESYLLSNLQWTDVLQKLKLNELSLQGNFHSDIVRSAIETQGSLERLDLKGSVAMNDNYLCHIGRQLLKLEKLILAYCGRITNDGVNQLVKLSNLKVLDLTGCHKLTSSSVHGIIGGAPNLSLLELHLQDINIDESTVFLIANSLPNLKVLSLSGCGMGVTDKSIQEIFDCQRKLQTLKIENCRCTDDGILGLATGNSIQDLEGLKVLSLRGCKKLTDLTITSGLRFPQLKFLDISHCYLITSASLPQLVQNCPTIEEICITSSKRMEYDSIIILTKGLGRLRLLSVDNCHDLSQIQAENWTQSRSRQSTNQVTLIRGTKLSKDIEN